ncbi:hypothetical protein CRUP_016909 [Coryphaenoides rupestris]|nr:hypothetical protein CRUP_016909 [Coryphaenoides rupestris]
MAAVAGVVANEVPEFQALLNKFSVEEVEVEVEMEVEVEVEMEVEVVVVGANLSGSKSQWTDPSPPPPEEMLLKDLPREALLRPLTRSEVLGMLFRLTIFGAATYYSIKWVVEAMDPTYKQKNLAKKKAEQLMKRIGVEGVKLNEYEMNIASLLVDPRSIKVTWRDIAGLDEVICELQDTTLIAKATAKASGCQFINLQPSTLTDKWYGESQKLTAGVFSLAVKIQPCIIFIDEIDSFLRNRSSLDHEATAMMKAQFMSLWDGLDTVATSQKTRERQEILKLILAEENTAGFSGSDLRELCRDGAMYRVRDYVRKEQMRQIAQQMQDSQEEEQRPLDEDRLRPITQLDLLFGLDKMRESKQATVSMRASIGDVALD